MEDADDEHAAPLVVLVPLPPDCKAAPDLTLVSSLGYVENVQDRVGLEGPLFFMNVHLFDEHLECNLL